MLSARTVQWHPQRLLLAAASGNVADADPLHNEYTVSLIKTESFADPPRVLGRTRGLTGLGWAPDGTRLAVSEDAGVSVYDLADGSRIGPEPLPACVTGPLWSSDGEFVVVGDDLRTVTVLRSRDLAMERDMHVGVDALAVSLEWDAGMLAAGNILGDYSVRVLDVALGREIAVLEGHTDTVVSLAFSNNARYLASGSSDNTVRIWRCRDWEPVLVLQRDRFSPTGGIAFHPSRSILAVKDGVHVDVFDIDYELLDGADRGTASRRYANAKVVLLGDTGVGKSALSLALRGEGYEPLDSTHGRQVWPFHREEVDDPAGGIQLREIMLWDLAGSPGYRMIQQLSLRQVAVALIVFDARHEVEPFRGVQYWNRALAQATRHDEPAVPRQTFLVAARVDRFGTPAISERIAQIREAWKLDDYFETSAKDELNIQELRNAILNGIDWERQSIVSSNELFEDIRGFILEERKQLRTLSTVRDLLHSFRRYRSERDVDDALRAAFVTCIGQLENQGLVGLFTFGDDFLRGLRLPGEPGRSRTDRAVSAAVRPARSCGRHRRCSHRRGLPRVVRPARQRRRHRREHRDARDDRSTCRAPRTRRADDRCLRSATCRGCARSALRCGSRPHAGRSTETDDPREP
jgi:small GTP-binding protein